MYNTKNKQKTRITIWNWMFRLVQQFLEGRRSGVEEKHTKGLMQEDIDIKPEEIHWEIQRGKFDLNLTYLIGLWYSITNEITRQKMQEKNKSNKILKWYNKSNK